jgi:hypothetical protein
MATPRGHHPSLHVHSGGHNTEWLSLTQLGRIYGISAVHTGKLLFAAGLRSVDGEPTAKALAAGLVQRQHPGQRHQALWNRQGCASTMEGHGMVPQKQHNLVSLWADLLSTLQQGCPWISVSAEEMANDMPHELVTPVNHELRQRGCNFQVTPPSLRKGATPQPVCSPSPAGA